MYSKKHREAKGEPKESPEVPPSELGARKSDCRPPLHSECASAKKT